MGTLIAFRYPTQLFLGLADHTYVACGTLGKAWGCWGGKTGGTELRRAPGSTARADAIAEADERAGITCYLVNGVCHQAANRILLPAGITVQGARGYSVSSALFGTYGRPRGILGLCRAPFNRNAGVSGDLAACIEAGRIGGDKASGDTDGGSERDRAYLERSLQLYAEGERRLDKAAGTDDIIGFQMAQFELFLDYRLGGDSRLRAIADDRRGTLMDIRQKTEYARLAAEQRFVDSGDVEAFKRDDDELTRQFQHYIGKSVDGETYTALFDLETGDDVTLADPEILAHAYSRRPPAAT